MAGNVTLLYVGATVIGLYQEGALVVFLFSISLRLEVIASERARHAIEALMELRPEIATLRRGDEEVDVPVGQVVPGEIFVVRPGDRVPLDGRVVEGETTVDPCRGGLDGCRAHRRSGIVHGRGLWTFGSRQRMGQSLPILRPGLQFIPPSHEPGHGGSHDL